MSNKNIYKYTDNIERPIGISKVSVDATDEPITMKVHMEIPDSLYQLNDIMIRHRYEVYIAGGAVRDTIVGESPKDYDISTNAAPEDVVRILSPYVKRVEVQGEASFAVARLIAYDGNEYEFAPYRIDSGTRKGGEAELSTKENQLTIKDDVMRRDLTINALFYKIPSREDRANGLPGEVVDYVGGISDIENEIIRTVGDPEDRFNEDRLRILRAFRFAGRVGGEINEDTANAIRSNNSLTEPSDAAVSEERIKEEIIKGVKTSKVPSYYINMLIDFDLFDQILPGLNVSKSSSSSRSVPVQLASILVENDSNTAEKVLKERKFSNDTKDSVRFLLNVANLNSENLTTLKGEWKRLNKLSKRPISDEDIMDFGVSVGQNLGKFLSFVSSPPVISARDLMAGGMLPGPEIGKAIRDAEVEHYFGEKTEVIQDDPPEEDPEIVKEQKLFDIVSAMVKVSNDLDARGLVKESDSIDGLLDGYSDFYKSASSKKEDMIAKLTETATRLCKLDLLPPELDEMDIPDIGRLFGVIKGGVSNNLQQKRNVLRSKLEEEGRTTDHICSMTMEEVSEALDGLKHPEKAYFVKSKAILSSLGFNDGEHVHVFDFDDTLMWTEEWHSSVEVDESGYVMGPGRSRSVASALRVFEESDFSVDLGLKKELVDMPKMGKESQTSFRVVRLNDANENITSDELRGLMGSKALDRSTIDVREKYVDFPAVTVDGQFYADPETAGKIGPNPEVFEKYVETSSGKVIILTARSDVPGMSEEINKVIMESGGRSPDHIFTKPSGSSGSKYKGEIILQLAKELGPSGEITFYDDNPRYTDGVLSALSGASDVAKVNIVNIDSSSKPTTAFDIISRFTKLANSMDAAGNVRCADAVDNIILKMSNQNFEDKEIMGPVTGILGLARKLEGSGGLVNPPPSKEELMEEGREHGPVHLRRWFQIMKGEEERSPDYNRKKQAIERINELVISSGLGQYGFDEIDMQDIDNMTLEQLNDIKSSAEDAVGKINAMGSGNIIKIHVSSGDVRGAIGDWEPPDGFEILKNDSFHVTIISPQTVANFKDLMGEDEYSSLKGSIEEMSHPTVILSKDIGLAIRPEKKTYALAVENQQEFEDYRDEIVDKISSALKPLGSRVNPMNWWFERAEPDRDRFFHVSIANDGDGWPTSSVSDIRESDFEVS